MKTFKISVLLLTALIAACGNHDPKPTFLPENLTVETIVYREGEFSDRAWKLNLIYDHTDTSTRPGLIFMHGGSWQKGDYNNLTYLAAEYAQKGYVCITPAYRLLQEESFPAAIEDAKNSVRWLRAHAAEYNMDPDRIGIFGNSAGAHLACMAALTKPADGLEGDGSFLETSSAVQAVVAVATPTDFSLFPSNALAILALDGFEGSYDEKVKKASPVSYVHKDAPPLMLIHSTADKTVVIAHADRLSEALNKAGAKDVTYLRIESKKHDIFFDLPQEINQQINAFFERTLKQPYID